MFGYTLIKTERLLEIQRIKNDEIDRLRNELISKTIINLELIRKQIVNLYRKGYSLKDMEIIFPSYMDIDTFENIFLNMGRKYDLDAKGNILFDDVRCVVKPNFSRMVVSAKHRKCKQKTKKKRF